MSVKLEDRVAALERQLASLQQRQESVDSTSRAWLDDLYGKFADDPIFAEAMKLGRKYRKSLQTDAKAKAKQ